MDLDKRKEFSMASGGRMFLLLGGIMLIFTAVTNTGQYGVQMFMIASEAVKGTEEYVEVLESIGMGIWALRIMGGAFLVTALVEVTAGVWCIRSSNRVDRSRGTLRVVLALLGVEIVMQVYLLLMHMSGLGMLLSALLMPLVLLWGATRLRKLAKLYPDRVYAIEKNAAPVQKHPAAQSAKSLRERAMMSAREVPGEQQPEMAVPEEDRGEEQKETESEGGQAGETGPEA